MIEENIVCVKNEWSFCQENSSMILAEGIELLRNSTKYSIKSDFPSYSGNYLISSADAPYYIGEAQNIKKRIKQQFRKSSSTFYKNYLRKHKTKEINERLDINNFDVQIIKTLIGTKEIEEFGIVNLETKLNKFQLGKRTLYDGRIDEGNWNWIQNNFESVLLQGEKQFLKNKPYRWYDAQVQIGPGIYYVESESHGLIYIGESSSVLDRYKTHSSDTRFSALRRHIATEILRFELKTKKELGLNTQAKKDKKMYLAPDEDLKVNKFLENCSIRTEIINFGRYELENHLIQKLKPMLNIKGNK